MIKKIFTAFFGASIIGLTTGVETVFAISQTPPPVVNGWVQISSPAELLYVDQNPSQYLTAKIELTASIDLSGISWQPLGTKNTPFNGMFNGQNYAISNLSVTGSLEDSGFLGSLGALR